MYKLLIFTSILLSITGCNSDTAKVRCIEFCESRHLNCEGILMDNNACFCKCSMFWKMPDNEYDIKQPIYPDGGIK